MAVLIDQTRRPVQLARVRLKVASEGRREGRKSWRKQREDQRRERRRVVKEQVVKGARVGRRA